MDIRCILVGIMSGRGHDLMTLQGRRVDCEYFIPNLHYWFTESGLTPFLGGDSVLGGGENRAAAAVDQYDFAPTTIPSTSMTPPRPESSACPGRPWRTPGRFCWPWSASTSGICGVPLTLRRLGEAVHSPRPPRQGQSGSSTTSASRPPPTWPTIWRCSCAPTRNREAGGRRGRCPHRPARTGASITGPTSYLDLCGNGWDGCL